MKGPPPPKMDGHKNHHSPKREHHHQQQQPNGQQGGGQQQAAPPPPPPPLSHPFSSYPGSGPYHHLPTGYGHFYQGQGSSQNSSPLSSYPPRVPLGSHHHLQPPSYGTHRQGPQYSGPYTLAPSALPYQYLHSYLPYSVNFPISGGGGGAAAVYFHLNAKLQELSNRLHSWKAISIGLSFLALILLSCKLYDVDREIHYLQFVANDWLSQATINRDLLHLPSTPIPSASSSFNGPGGGGIGGISGSTTTAAAANNPNLYSLMGAIGPHGSNKSDISSILSSAFTSSSSLLSSSRPPPASPLSLAMTSPFASSYNHHNHHGTSGPANSQQHSNLQNHRQTSLPLPHYSHQFQLPSPPSGSLHSESDTNLGSQSLILSQQSSSSQLSQQPQSQQQHMQIVDPHLQNAIFLMENLREDIEILIVELWSSRTTLVLSLVFVFVYIISWCWMAYAIRETTTPQDISLKTVLLLAIFAAVDIAASAGFVMVRVIMYVMRDYYFPRDMRTPVLSAEFNQLAAYAALRLVTLKSSTGVVDIFVSVIVGFLTSLRVYSVICAVSFYRRARKEILNVNNFEYMIEKSSPRLMPSGGDPAVAMFANGTTPGGMALANGALKKGPPGPTDSNGFIPKMRLLNAHKDLERRFSLAGESDVGSSSDDDPATELKIQAADMPPQMQKSAVQSTVHALRTYSTEKHIAESVKQNFDQMFEPTWHCIVGRNWGSCVTHTKANYIRMLYKDLTILLYKSS